MSYTPQPGTIPYRVINWLREKPVGAEFAGAEICEALDISLEGFSSCLATARRAGVMAARPMPGHARALLWSLGDGTPLPEPEDHEPDKPLHAPAPRLPVPVAKAEQPVKAPPVAIVQKAKHFRVGVFSDGAVVIELGSNEFTLTPDQAKELVQFVEGAGK